jgi:hypothetical protein
LRRACLVSPKAIAITGLSAIAIAAGGCSGGSDFEAQGRGDITKLRAELKERFGTPPNEAPWYRHITGINWANGQVEITTDLEEGSELLGGDMCGKVFGLAFEQVGEPPELSVAVVDSEGNVGGCA